MELRLTLQKDNLVRIQGVVIAEEKNTIVFESSAYNIAHLKAVVTNGIDIKPIDIKNRTLDISNFTKNAGAVEIKLSLITKGRVAKTWEIEPIIVRELNNSAAIVPEIINLRNDVALLKASIKELNTKLNNSL